MAAVFAIFLVEFCSTRYLASVDSRIDRDTAAASLAQVGLTEEGLKTHGGDNDSVAPKEPVGSTHYGHHHYMPPPLQGEVDAGTDATRKLGVAILEAGIIFHSVFIGLTLAVSTGSDFVSLFITIIFHRMSRP